MTRLDVPGPAQHARVDVAGACPLHPGGGRLLGRRRGVDHLFARRVGRMAARIGPKVFLMAGPVPAGSGLLRLAC
jgi:hypothetical protein